MKNHDTGKVDAKKARIIVGDCLEVLKGFESDSIDSLVTDPPAGIGFMGQEWDHHKGGRAEWVAWMTGVMRECHRVMKPGAHALVWAIPRTSHWTATAVENAGFEVKDQIFHLFGQGFPKSLNISKAAEKAGIACVCHKDALQCHNEDLRSLREELGTENALSKGAESNVLPVLRGSAHQADCPDPDKAASNLPNLRQTLQAEKQDCSAQGENLLLQVQRCNEALEPGVCCSPSGDCTKHERPESEAATRCCQSSLEGRSHFQAEQGQLHRTEIRQVPGSVQGDGSEGRLCDGASSSDGEASGPMSQPNGSGASQGPQHAEQSAFQSGVIPEQPCPQTCGRCGKAKFKEGFGTALKPACEVWILARKPLSEKNVASNVLKHGVGGINIDGCRVGSDGGTRAVNHTKKADGRLVRWDEGSSGARNEIESLAMGRFPANLVLSCSPFCSEEQHDIECAIAMLDEQSLAGGMHSAGRARDKQMVKKGGNPSFEIKGPHNMRRLGDSGGASRFFFNSRYSEEECSQSSASSVSEISSLDLNLDGFAQKLAAIADLPEEIASSDLLAAFTVAIQSGLKQKSARNIEAILNTGARCLREFRLTSISNNNPVSLAATQRLTDIITTTLSPLTCSGSADRATSGTTPPNLERGAKDSANRFIYCAKISPGERNAGLEGMPKKFSATMNSGIGQREHDPNEPRAYVQNHHPTVKPQKLMRYLCKLVTPPGGLVLDPFAGSFSTGVAALAEGFGFIGIEKEADYIEIGKRRLAHAHASYGNAGTNKSNCSDDLHNAHSDSLEKAGHDEQK